MLKEDIKFARAEIEKHRKDTPYGTALSMPWLMLEEALDKNAQLANLIEKHNHDCRQDCEWRIEHGRCDGYVQRGKQCPECPREYEIERGE